MQREKSEDPVQIDFINLDQIWECPTLGCPLQAYLKHRATGRMISGNDEANQSGSRISNTQKQWLSSSPPEMDTLQRFNNIPWLVSIDETCQGIILNHWWILSTVNCLTKLKYLTSDISKVINKEGILHGDKICLHPSINPRDGKYTVKEIIGVIRLQFPIRGKEISLSQSYNIFRRTCFNCLYKQCRVYQYQIIQQGSPVLCIFGSHWEVVGLVSESSMTCDSPILVIKTAPYLSWMRWFIKTDQKPLDPIFPLLCNFYPGIEDGLNNSISNTVFASSGFSFESWSRLTTSSQSRLRRNPPPFFFVSSNKDSFASSQHYFQDGHIFSASKFSTSRPRTTPMFKTLGIYNSAVLCNNPISSHSECFIHSETSTHSKAYISSRFPKRNALKYPNGIIAGSGRYWTDIVGAIPGFYTISINSVESLIPLSKQIDGFQIDSEIYSLHSPTKSSMFPSLGQFVVGSWLEISPDIRSWAQTHAVPYETETVIWSPFNKEINQTQTYYMVEKVATGADVETYSLNLWAPLLVSKIELSTHFMFNDYGYQYSSATPKLNALFNRAWYLVKSQSTSTKSEGKFISSVSKTNLLSSTLTIPFSWPLLTDNPFMSWDYYKQSKIIESSQLHLISPLNKHETSIVKPQKQVEDITWTLFHSKIIKPLVYSKINFKRQWKQTASDILHLLTFSEIKSGKYFDTLKSDKASLWLQTKNKKIKFQKHPKFKFDSPRIKSREGKIKYWMKARGGTIMTLDQTETQTVVSWNHPESSRVGYWYWSNYYHTLLKTHQDVKTSLHFTYLDVDIAGPLSRSTGKIQHSKKSEPFRVRSWIHSEGPKNTHWAKLHTEENKWAWFHVQTKSIWHQSESQVNHYLSKIQDEKILPLFKSKIDTLKTLIKTEFPILPSWTKHEGDQQGLWTQNQNNFATYWLQIQMKTISQWTQPITQTDYKWRMSETETSRLWNPPMLDKLRNWIHHKVYTVKTLDDLDHGIIKPRVYKEVRTLIKWRQDESPNINSQLPYETDRAILWTQDKTPVVNDWKDLLEDRDTTWMDSQIQELNDWKKSKIVRFTRWTKTEAPLLSLWTLSEMDTFTQSAISKSSNINLLIDSIIYTKPSWTKNKPAVKSKSINDTLILWGQAKIPASLWTQSQRDEPMSSLQYESRITNNWVISECYLTSLWPKAHYPEINSLVKFKGEIITVWAPEEYPALNLWKQIEVETTTKLTHTETLLETSCAFHVSDLTIFTQANSPSVIHSVNPDYDEIITWFPSKTLPVNPWTPAGRNLVLTHYKTSGKNLFTETKYDTDTPRFHNSVFTEISWTQAETMSELVLDDAETINMWNETIDALKKSWTKDEFQLLTSFTEMRTDSFTPLIPTESPTSNTWALHVSDKINLWTQAIRPTGYWLTESEAPTVTIWLKSNPLLVNLWLQKISDRVILPLPQAEYPPLNLQSPAITYTVIPQLLQPGYAPINLWRKPASDIIIIPWNQPELFNQKTHLVYNTRVLPWPEPEQIPKNLWLLPISDTLMPQWLQYESPKVSIVPPVNFDALIISTPSWSQKHTSEMNLRTLFASDKKTTAWSQSEYSIRNMLILPMHDRVTSSRSQSKSLPAYLQTWTIFNTMMQSCTEDKYTLRNQWSHILSGAVTSSWHLDDFQETNLWEQLVSGEFMLPRILVSSPEVNPWDFLISDTIIVSWPESKYLPVNRGPLLRYNKIAPSWPKLPVVDLKTSSVSDIIMPHWLQKTSPEGNLWPWGVSGIVTQTWTQIESPILSLRALIQSIPEPSNAFSIRNIWPNHPVDIITEPCNHTETPGIFHVSVTISSLPQTEFQAGNLWQLPLSDTVIPLLTHLGSLSLYPRTLLTSDFTTSPWTLSEPLPSKLWTSSIVNRLIMSLSQTESKNVNIQTLFVDDTIILPWTPSTYQTLTPWTEKVDNILSQWTMSEVHFVNSQIQSEFDTNQNHLQTPAITHWAHVISDHVLFRNQDASPVIYFWKKYGVDAFAEWASSESTNTKHPTEPISNILKHAKISTTYLWINFETNIISRMSQANSRILNPWTHTFGDTITSLIQSVSLILIPWAKFQSSTIKIVTQIKTPVQVIFDRVTPWSQALLSVESPTFHVSSTDVLWKLTDIKAIKSGKQSTTEMVLQTIIDKFSLINSFPKIVLDNILLSDHMVSTIESRWTQTEADAMIWTRSEPLKKYIQTNPYSKILTKWGPSEFSEQIVWTEPEAGKAMIWQQGKSKYFIPQIRDTAKVVKVRSETESSVITYFAKLVANSPITQIQTNFPAMNVDVQHLHDKFIFRINTNHPITKSWIKEENAVVNTKGISVNDLVQPATEIERLCIYMMYSTFNSLLQREHVVTVWSQVEPQQIKFPWEKTKLSNIIHWTQSDSPSIYPCINNKLSKLIPWTDAQYIPEYRLADSKAISWSETESFLANMWRETTFSKVISWTQAESLSVSHSMRFSTVIPWIQREFPLEAIWIGYTAPKVIQWIQEESTLDSSESMELRYTTINKRVWPSYSPIILAHSESSEVFLPMNSQTFTPLTWNEFPLNNHWAHPVSDILIPQTKILYIPQNIWTEVVYSTFVPRTKFISSSEIIPIKLTYDSITPWTKDKTSEIITCILSDYHACVTSNQLMSLNSVLIGATTYIVTKTFQAQSSLDHLAPTITTKFTTWRLDELSLWETELKPITSILVAWTQTDVSQNLIAESSKTIGTSLNSTTVLPGQFYIKTETVKGTFLTVTESKAKKMLTVSNSNTLIVSVHAPTYVIQNSTQIMQTSFLWAPTETLDRNTWTFSELGSLLSWKVPVPLAAGYELHHKPKNWLKTTDERIKPWTQSDFQIINIFTSLTTSKVESYDQHIMDMHSASGVFNTWSQSETESTRFWNISNDDTVRSWFQNEDSIDNTRIQIKSNTVKVWPQADSEVIRFWNQSVSNIPLSQSEIEREKYLNISDINVVLSWFQFQKISTRQRTKLEHEIITSWIQQEWQIAHSWNELEIKVVKTRSDFKTDASQILLTYSKSDEIKLWTQPESQLVRRWPEDVIVTLWSLTKNDAIKSWPELEHETAQSLAQLSTGIINPWIQRKASTETSDMISWIYFDTVISYPLQTQIDSTFQSLTQIYGIRQWSQPEYETTELFTQPNVGMSYPWIQHETSTETLEIIPRTHSDTVVLYSLQTQIDFIFESLTQIYAIKQLSHPEFEITKYLTHPNVGIIKPWTQPETSSETLRIIPWTHSDTVISYPLQTQIDSTFQSLTQIYGIKQWSQPEYETTESLTQPNVGMAYPWIQHKDSTETLEIISWTHSNTVIYSLQTQIDFTLQYLPQNYAIRQPSQAEYETIRSLAQTNDHNINPWIQHKASTETLKLIFWTHSDTVISYSVQTLIDSFRFWNQLQPKSTQIWNPTAEQVGKTPVLTEVGKVTPSFQFQECGLRPGLVPHCPNCWEAEIGEFPWIVSVQLSYSHFCAGSILNEKWILTSARCANFVKRSEALALVQVGLVDLQDPTQGEIVGIHRSMPYLGPSGPLGPGLILLKEPLRFQPLVLPICLEESQEQDRQIQLYDCWLPSWSLMRGSPGILQKRHLSIMQVSTCAKFWPQLNEFTFCVEAKKAMGESGCKGDLGAPLVCHLQHKDTWVQMGILIHFDENCKKPYVFSHVSPFIFWLQRVTQPSHGPWSNQRPVTISSSNSLSVFTKRKVSTFTSSNDSIHPHYITLSQPQALADHISLQYTMPWQALIFSCGNQICSGSIISSYWILTSAHCVRRMNPKDTVVILGFRNPGTPLRVVKVTTILLHEQFRLLNQASRNDLALVLLQEGQSSIHIVAPLGNIKNLNTSECWLSGPQILTQGDILENPEMLQIQVMGGSNCAYLYPDIGGSTVCYTAQARGPEINMGVSESWKHCYVQTNIRQWQMETNRFHQSQAFSYYSESTLFLDLVINCKGRLSLEPHPHSLGTKSKVL
ncbi:Serine protease 55 [Apodemus speciosus]|uniref:Serine protease 55 n=1 Tax=Apodemus speciosus TaxID=105296 RepID=A0ABQ0FW22_APOSI